MSRRRRRQGQLTYRDYARIREDRRRHEILAGIHVVATTPWIRHQEVSGNILCPLAIYLDAHDFGEILPGPIDLLLSDHDILIPDIEFTRIERAAILKEENIQGPPDLVIEILSRSTRRRDLGPKRSRYEKLGVREYWALDPDRDEILVFRRGGETFLPPLRLRAEAEDRLATPLIPGLELSLREVFERPEPRPRPSLSVTPRLIPIRYSRR